MKKLYGKSGCTVEILNRNFDFYIKKYSKNLNQNYRLILQAQKQIDFYEKNSYPYIKTPKITSIYSGNESELAYIEMKYIIGKDAIHFLKESNIITINSFIENIIFYTDNLFRNIQIGNTENIIKKVDQISKIEFPNKNKIMNILNNIPKETLLIGECHGDMTMANMILTDSTVYLLDFLNTYINSPILDLLSIRQDTHHLWSCFLSKTYSCRPIETLKYIDNELKLRYSWVIKSEWYRYLSLMNYVRMYPFNTDSHTTEFITNCIKEYL